jgi:hypothetical protein
MSGIIYDHKSDDQEDRFHIDLGDGRLMLVNVTNEGVIMDVFGTRGGIAGVLARIGAGEELASVLDGPPDEDVHLGTMAMTFDEWADEIISFDSPTRVGVKDS